MLVSVSFSRSDDNNTAVSNQASGASRKITFTTHCSVALSYSAGVEGAQGGGGVETGICS